MCNKGQKLNVRATLLNQELLSEDPLQALAWPDAQLYEQCRIVAVLASQVSASLTHKGSQRHPLNKDLGASKQSRSILHQLGNRPGAAVVPTRHGTSALVPTYSRGGNHA